MCATLAETNPSNGLPQGEFLKCHYTAAFVEVGAEPAAPWGGRELVCRRLGLCAGAHDGEKWKAAAASKHSTAANDARARLPGTKTSIFLF